MCGIAGMAGRPGIDADAALLARMTTILAHRGPDGEGFHLAGSVGLGHRRLAIIDLSTGAQPMGTSGGDTWIVFNGEIYNFRELRAELETLGSRFRTTSDTEVILAAYETWGVDCLPRLRGMFAFAVWDSRRRRLLLARDRVGIKPLVYAWDGTRLLFASEVKALLQAPSVGREIDWSAFRDYLMFLYVPGSRCIFKDVHKLPPASYLVLDIDGGEPAVHRYWTLTPRPGGVRAPHEWMEGLQHHLEDAVRSHLVSDVPVGAFLSGGIDSSAVVALMARAAHGRVRTFSIGFDEADFDETVHARTVATRYATDHCEFIVKPAALEALPRLAWQFDEPFGDASALPTYYVAKVTREHVTVALSGDGGDEVFAGYRRYADATRLHRRLDRPPGLLLRPLLRLAGRLLPPGARGQGYFGLLGAEPLDRYLRMVTFQRRETLRSLLTPEIHHQTGPAVGRAAFDGLAARAPVTDYVSTLQFLDINTYLPDDILTKVDRTSMLVSLETRVPLLDHVLMEYVASVPPEMKLRGGVGKVILREAMAHALPAELLGRSKMGFGVPLGLWLRGELGDYARETLLGQRARERGWFNPSAVARLVDQHRSGRRDHTSQVWSLLCLEEWARRWADGKGAAA